MATILKVERSAPVGLRVFFADGTARVIKLARYARKGRVFAALADPAYALRCRIADRGHALRWPDGMDMSADALAKMGKPVIAAGPEETELPVGNSRRAA